VSQVVTGEAVALDLRPARLASRTLAALIDAALQFALLLMVAIVAGSLSLNVGPSAGAALAILVLVLVLLVYPVTFETVLRGRTPGKAAMGLRVVRDDGGPIRFRHALVRGLAGAFVERPGLFLVGLGVFVAVACQLLNERGKRLGDILAGTFVLQERLPKTASIAPGMPPPLASWAAGLDLTRLDDNLALSCRQFLGRASQLDGRAREQVGGRLVAAVAAVTAPPPPPGTPGWAYLAAVLAERRRREEARLAARQQAAAPRSQAAIPPSQAAAPPSRPAPPAGMAGQPVAPEAEPARSAEGRDGFALPS